MSSKPKESDAPIEKTLKAGDVILTMVQFTDSADIKTRPAVILFEEFENYIIAGITSNPAMQGIPLTISEGAIKPSVIKLNYIFTISSIMVKRKLFPLSPEKRRIIYDALTQRFHKLVE